jgi:hypothetical protein
LFLLNFTDPPQASGQITETILTHAGGFMGKNLKKIINMEKYFHWLKKLSFHPFFLNSFATLPGFYFFGFFVDLFNKLPKNFTLQYNNTKLTHNHTKMLSRGRSYIFFGFLVDLSDKLR